MKTGEFYEVLIGIPLQGYFQRWYGVLLKASKTTNEVFEMDQYLKRLSGPTEKQHCVKAVLKNWK